MYAALWRALPGNTWLKAAIMVALVLAALAVCVTWVFPAMATWMPFNDPNING